MLDTAIPLPRTGRTVVRGRRIRLSDVDAHGRLRLDAVARFLQDIAIDDVQETGWGLPDHLWFVRSILLDVLEPFAGDTEVELTTWCSGVAAIAAGRRWSLTGDAGGRIEVDSVWIHLDAEQRPARIEDFGVYGEAAGGRHVSTKLALPNPPDERTAKALGVAGRGCRPPRTRQQRGALAGRGGHLAGDWSAAGRARLPAAPRPRRRARARAVRQLSCLRDRRRHQGRSACHAYLSRSFSRRPSAIARPTTVITAR